jgi:hypothetical protein
MSNMAGEGSNEIKKVWVCGPPLVEELFDHFMEEKICPKFGIDFKT